MRTLAPISSLFSAAIIVLFAAANTYAQSGWEYSPYRIQVWIAMDSAPELTDRMSREIAQAMMRRGDATAGNIWDISASAAPETLATGILSDIESLSADEIAGFDRDSPEVDKIVVLGVTSGSKGFRIEARELDIHTRHWGPRLIRTTQQPLRIPNEAFLAMVDSFRPLARIEKTTEKQDGDKKIKYVVAQLRARGLYLPGQKRGRPLSGDVLLPVQRRNDRTGNLRPNGIQIIPWTLLTMEGLSLADIAEEVRVERDIECRIHTGVRSPIRRGSSRVTKQFLLLVTPVKQSTRLVIKSNDQIPRSLTGYEIYSRRPGTTVKGENAEASQLLGWTDWKGEILISRGDVGLRMLYVKNGGQVLARLPMLAGLTSQETFILSDDVLRLRAEGIVKGLQSEIMDIAVRRQLLAADIRRLIDAREFEKAKEKIDRLYEFRTVNELDNMLSNRQSENFTSEPRTRAKIELLFSDLRQQLNEHPEHFDRALADELSQKLESAR